MTVDPKDQQEIDTIVVLEVDKPARGIPPVAKPSDSLAFGKPTSASNVYRGRVETYGPDKAFDDLPQTRWATDVDTNQCWLQVNLETPIEIARVVIDEAYGERVRRFELQYKEGQQWRTFYKGTTIGVQKRFSFPPIKAQNIRLNILEATAGPTITEFELFGPTG